jgi:hypothetical protein
MIGVPRRKAISLFRVGIYMANFYVPFHIFATFGYRLYMVDSWLIAAIGICTGHLQHSSTGIVDYLFGFSIPFSP